MTNEGGWLRYKCRMCGETFNGPHAPLVMLTVLNILCDLPQSHISLGSASMLLADGKFDFHHHTSGPSPLEHGVADLVGYMEDES